MVLTEIDDRTNTGVIVLRPNNSWSWRANVAFLSIFMGVSLTIAIGFLFAGAWVIMPYSILEITVVAACIHYCVKQCSRQEVITVTTTPKRVDHIINTLAPLLRRAANIHSNFLLFADRETLARYDNNPYHPEHFHRNLEDKSVHLLDV